MNPRFMSLVWKLPLSCRPHPGNCWLPSVTLMTNRNMKLTLYNIQLLIFPPGLPFKVFPILFNGNSLYIDTEPKNLTSFFFIPLSHTPSNPLANPVYSTLQNTSRIWPLLTTCAANVLVQPPSSLLCCYKQPNWSPCFCPLPPIIYSPKVAGMVF